jgi:hypothetical protein
MVMEQPRYLLCFRYDPARIRDDRETVWTWVQTQGGFLERCHLGYADFYLPETASLLAQIKYPELQRISGLDYLV